MIEKILKAALFIVLALSLWGHYKKTNLEIEAHKVIVENKGCKEHNK